MEQFLAWWGAWGPLVLAILGTAVGLAIWVARGEGKELADLVVKLILNLSAQGWDSVTEVQVKDIAGRVYDGAYNYIGPSWFRVIPWRALITRTVVQDWSWQAWQKGHAWYDSSLAKSVVTDAKSARVVPAAVKLRL